MRRLLALAIVLILGLPTVSPLFALTRLADPTLPVCCRRGGQHRCAGMTGINEASTSPQTQATAAVLSGRCPYGSHSLPANPHPDPSLDSAAAIFAGVVSHPSANPQTESKRRISADRSRHKRGPPASPSSQI